MTQASAPGRVNLIGEHTDYNEGLVLPLPIPQRTAVDLARRGDGEVQLESEGFPSAEYVLGEERRTGDWADHVRGVTWALAEAGHRAGGFAARVRSAIPAGAGLGSSAALEVAVLRALRDAYALQIDDLALGLLAHRAESGLVGARVGTMDHLASSLGRDGEALLIDARTLATLRVPLPPDLALVVIDSGIAHEHATGEYNTRREECAEAARRLGVRALRDANSADIERLRRADPVLARRAAHVVRENDRVRTFVSALRGGELAICGQILDASHASLRDSFEVSLPEIDILVRSLRAQDGVYGARLVGGGFGGSVLGIARPDRASAAARAAADAYGRATGRTPRVLLPVG